MGSQVGRQISDWTDEAGDTIRSVQRQCRTELTRCTSQGVAEIERAASRVEETFDETLPELVSQALPAAIEQLYHDLTSEAVKPVLAAAADMARTLKARLDSLADSRPELVEAIDMLGFRVDLSVNVELGLHYQGFYTRAGDVITVLDRYASQGIGLRRQDVISFVRACGPTFIDLGVGAEMSLGVNIGGKGAIKGISTDLFAELADVVLDQAGVPD